MPTAPRASTLLPFSTRPLTPRWHTTTLPAKAPSAVASSHSASLYGASAAFTTGAGVVSGRETVIPGTVRVLASEDVSVVVPMKERLSVLAATVVTHGSRWSVVSGVGPLLPA